MSSGSSRRNRIGALHDRLALVVAVFVPLSAVPLASNRATWWLLWTAVLAAVAFVATLRFAAADPRYSPRLFDHKALLAFVLLFPLWAVLQFLPFAEWLPEQMVASLRQTGGTASTISVQPDVAISGVLRFLGYIILMLLVVEVASRRDRVLRVAQIVFAGVCLQAIWAVVALKLLGDFSPWGEKTAYLGSATGTFVNRNSLATFLGFGIILGLGILFERAQRSSIRSTRRLGGWMRVGDGDVLVSVGLLFLFVGLVYTQSRLGLVASVTGAAATLALLRWRAGIAKIRVMAEVALLLVLLVLAVALLAAGDGVAERLLFLGNESVNRLAIYQQTLTMIAARPLTGFGMDAFGMAFEAFRGPPLLAPVTYDLAHNSYLMLWSEFGLIFGSVPLLALAAIGVLLLRRMWSDAGFSGIAAAGLGALVLGAVHSLGDFSLEIPANVYLLVLILGLGLGRQSRRRSGHPAEGASDLPDGDAVEPLIAPSGGRAP